MNQEQPPNSSSAPSVLSSPNSETPAKRPIPGWAKAAILIGVVGLGSIGYLSSLTKGKNGAQSESSHEVDPKELSRRTPVQDFILADANGQQKKLSEYKGNVVLLSFWASWCAPCLQELPTFAELEKRLYNDGLRVVPINVDEGNEGKDFSKRFWETRKFNFPSYFDSSKTVAKQFGVDMLPANFILDREGRIAFSSFGANDWTNPETVEIIEDLLHEGPLAETAATSN